MNLNYKLYSRVDTEKKMVLKYIHIVVKDHGALLSTLHCKKLVFSACFLMICMKDLFILLIKSLGGNTKNINYLLFNILLGGTYSISITKFE